MSEFYVGYASKAPRATAVWIRRCIIAVFAGVAVIALALVFAQRPFAPSSFEFGVTRTFAGVLHETPAPSIELIGGKHALLVAPGKHGASDLIRGLDGRAADLAGSRIRRGPDLMIEVVPGSIRVFGDQPAERPAWVFAGDVSVRGEIVDSKCYLGVMNPGEGKVHRDCAARCISGGAPPALIAADRDGRIQFLLLTGRNGRAINRHVLRFVGEPVQVTGTLYRWLDQVRLESEPASIQPVE
jgi:hypothetical protein